MSEPFLSRADLDAIEVAVSQAEAATTGEIYCVVAERSSDYMLTPLAWAAGAALLAPGLMLLAGLDVGLGDWLRLGGWTAQAADPQTSARLALTGVIVLQTALFVVVLTLVSLGGARIALTPRAFKRDRVRQRAEEQFLARNLQSTRERTGVLIYVSRAERMAELVADEGIDAKVTPQVWADAMAALTGGLHRGEAGAGFTEAIRRCGAVLAEHFPPRPRDNPDELPNRVVFLKSS